MILCYNNFFPKDIHDDFEYIKIPFTISIVFLNFNTFLENQVMAKL